MTLTVHRVSEPPFRELKNANASRVLSFPNGFLGMDYIISTGANLTKHDVSFLIGALEEIVNLHLGQFGFNPRTKTADEIIIGHKAESILKSLRESESDIPAQHLINKAMEFFNIYGRIKTLKEISKLRGERFGFDYRSIVLEEDKLLAKRAEEFASLVARESIPSTMSEVEDFMESYSLICALEECAREKLGANMGLAINNIDKEEIKIGEQALFLAKDLKLEANGLTITHARKFLKEHGFLDAESTGSVGMPNIVSYDSFLT